MAPGVLEAESSEKPLLTLSKASCCKGPRPPYASELEKGEWVTMNNGCLSQAEIFDHWKVLSPVPDKRQKHYSYMTR